MKKEKDKNMGDFRKSEAYRKEVAEAKTLVSMVWEALTLMYSDRKIKSVESNFFHFVIYSSIEDMKKKGMPYPNLTRGWFIHGPYIMAVDDAMIEMGAMDSKYHQMCGEKGAEIQEQLVIFEGEANGKKD